MNNLQFCINTATCQEDIVAALKRYHQLDLVVAYIRDNYDIGYNDDCQIHPEHKPVPLDELKAFILAALQEIK